MGDRFTYELEQNRLIEIKRYRANKREVEEQKRNAIIFILEGEAKIRLNSHPLQTIGIGEFFFVPRGFIIEWCTLDRLQLLIIHPESLADIAGIIKIEKQNDAPFRCVTDNPEDRNSVEKLISLKANKHIHSYASILTEYIEDGLNESRLFNIKINEFLFLLSTQYSQEEIKAFFHAIVSPDVFFAEFIKQNYSRYKTVKELAGAMHMTQGQLSVKFKNVFGISPYQWIIGQKIKRIRREISENKKTNKEIAHNNGFSNPQQFYDFCRIHIGATPSQIRKEDINRQRDL